MTIFGSFQASEPHGNIPHILQLLANALSRILVERFGPISLFAMIKGNGLKSLFIKFSSKNEDFLYNIY